MKDHPSVLCEIDLQENKQTKKSVLQRYNHTYRLNRGIAWTLFETDVW